MKSPLVWILLGFVNLLSLFANGNNKGSLFLTYPNPTTQFINIYLPQGSLSKEISFELLDISGKVVKTFAPKIEEAAFMMDVEDLPQGIYLLTIGANGDAIGRHKILKE